MDTLSMNNVLTMNQNIEIQMFYYITIVSQQL